MQLHQPFEYWARINPDMEFGTTMHERLSYGQAAERVARLAGAFASAGLEPGTRVAILAKNCLDYALFYLAVSKAGVVPVPVNFRLAPGEWAYILENSGARALLAQPAYAEVIDSLRPQLRALRYFVALGEAPLGWEPLGRWLESDPLSDAATRVRAWPEMSQVYTSGTTGRPKGVVLSQSAVLAVMAQYRLAYRLGRGDRMLLVTPMYHMGGPLWTGFAASCGASLYIMSDFDASDVVHVLDEERIAFAFLVPSMIQACLRGVGDVGDRVYAHLRMLGYGASPIAESTLRRALDAFGCEFVQAFGMTEVPNVTYLTPADHQRGLADHPDLLLSAGQAGPGSAVRIVDEADRELGVGEVGEICGCGPQLMNGYWRLPEITASALRGGWMHTGDAGYVDEEGYLYIKDRVQDRIVSGGENIYPREIEDVLFTHPAVADVAVIGVPSERWGEEVKAIAVLAPGQHASADELVEWCKGRVAGFKRPRSVDFRDALPRNASGKTLKRQLREPYWQGLDRRVS